MRHGVAVKRLCVRFVMTADDIISGRTAGGRTLMDTKLIRRRLLRDQKEHKSNIRDENEGGDEEE